VTARLKKVEGMLDVLTGRASQPKVYGPQGMFQQPRANARVLASV
jgi:flagellar biosynthesis protein FlgN